MKPRSPFIGSNDCTNSWGGHSVTHHGRLPWRECSSWLLRERERERESSYNYSSSKEQETLRISYLYYLQDLQTHQSFNTDQSYQPPLYSFNQREDQTNRESLRSDSTWDVGSKSLTKSKNVHFCLPCLLSRGSSTSRKDVIHYMNLVSLYSYWSDRLHVILFQKSCRNNVLLSLSLFRELKKSNKKSTEVPSRESMNQRSSSLLEKHETPEPEPGFTTT